MLRPLYWPFAIACVFVGAIVNMGQIPIIAILTLAAGALLAYVRLTAWGGGLILGMILGLLMGPSM